VTVGAADADAAAHVHTAPSVAISALKLLVIARTPLNA
jgi:hypothetical protein